MPWMAISTSSNGIEVRRRRSSTVLERQARRGQRGEGPTREQMHAFAKLTQIVDGHLRIVQRSALFVPHEALARADGPEHTRTAHGPSCAATQTLPADRRHLLEDSGTSTPPAKSSGSAAWARGWILLMLGRDDATRCSCRSRRPRRRCSSRISAERYKNQRRARGRRASR